MRRSAPSEWNISVLRISRNDGWLTRSGAFLLLRICACERTPGGNVPRVEHDQRRFTSRFVIRGRRTARGSGSIDELASLFCTERHLRVWPYQGSRSSQRTSAVSKKNTILMIRVTAGAPRFNKNHFPIGLLMLPALLCGSER